MTDTDERPALLTDHDRCDRCGSRAYLRATFASGIALLFCGHHGREALAQLVVLGAEIYEEKL